VAARSKRLWNYFNGEPYLDNPRLFILNPEKKKRRTKKMARRAHRRRRSTRRLSTPRHRTRRRRSFRANAFVPNPRRRRRTYRRVARRGRRRSFRSNPFSLPGGNVLGFPIKQVMLAAGSVIAAPFIEQQLMRLMPVSFASTTAGRWAGKIGAAVGVGYIAKMAMGQEAARLAYIVLGANIVADAVSEFLPSMGMGYYQGMGMFSAPGGMVTSGARALGGTYQGVSPMLMQPMSVARDPYASTY
jgi:hypothetical protein